MSTARAYRIGEIAALTGVTPEALRYYEKQGLLPPPHRSAAGGRRYDADAIGRVRFIRQAQAVGLTLRDIRILTGSEDGGSRAACRRTRAVIAARLADLDARATEMAKFRETLSDHLRACDRALDAGREAECPAIEAIASGEVRS